MVAALSVICNAESIRRHLSNFSGCVLSMRNFVRGLRRRVLERYFAVADCIALSAAASAADNKGCLVSVAEIYLRTANELDVAAEAGMAVAVPANVLRY
jgi:hypothetical protein